jgi:hypothetical protein
LEKARAHPSYPYKTPAKSPIDSYRRQLYDGVLLTLEESYKISAASSAQQQLIFGLAKQLLQSEDLASVLTNVLGLRTEEVERFADLLRRTSLSSVIAVADLLVDRVRFLDELHVLVYGDSARYVRERRHLHKIVEGHTWLFGERFNLMGSDRQLEGLLRRIREQLAIDIDTDVTVSAPLRDIPDLYLTCDQWNEGAHYTQHLVVELKRPSVSLRSSHVEQLRRYAGEIVNHASWSQRHDGHHFCFILVSSDVSDDVRSMYQHGEEAGLLSRPTLDHPTELWALRWSDFIERRRQELHFLEQELVVSADPELLGYLRDRVGEYLPNEVNGTV